MNKETCAKITVMYVSGLLPSRSSLAVILIKHKGSWELNMGCKSLNFVLFFNVLTGLSKKQLFQQSHSVDLCTENRFLLFEENCKF